MFTQNFSTQKGYGITDLSSHWPNDIKIKKKQKKKNGAKFPQLMNNLENSVPIFNVNKKKLQKGKSQKSDNLQTPTIISI